MRVIVIGAGVVGLLTSVECVASGHEVTLVDAADPRHRHAASNDAHRVVRVLHVGERRLTVAAGRAAAGWRALGERLRTKLLIEIGALTALPASAVPSAIEDLAAAGEPAIPLTPSELAARCPNVVFPEGSAAVLEPRAGVVLAVRAMDAVLAWLRERRNVAVRLGKRVVSVSPGTVRLACGTELAGDAVLVAAGPWSRELLSGALAERLALNRQTTLYCKGFDGVSLPAIPSFGTAAGVWLVPPVGGTPLRVSAHHACRAVSAIDGFAAPERWREFLTGELATLLPGFGPELVLAARDAYYLSDPVTNGPLLVGEDAGVWQLAACGGMSFKFAPAIAAALAVRAGGAVPEPTGLTGVDEPRLATLRREER